MSGPRVVLASRLFPPEAGAAAFRLGALGQALAEAGARVTALTTRPPGGLVGEVPGVRARRWPVLRDAGGNVRGYVQFASFDGPLLLRLLLTRRPDVVVVEPPPTTGFVVRLVCGLRRVPYVYYAADVSSTAAAGIGVHPRVVALLRRAESWVMRGADSVLAVSEGVAAEVRALGVPADAVLVVGTGVDTDVFAPAAGLPAWTTPQGSPSLVYAGTMSEIHGADVFVRAFAVVADEFPQAALAMLGQGTDRVALQGMADRLCPGRVDFPGVVAAAEVARRMSAACAGLASVRPGRGYDMAFPTKMFATTACGTPVIYAGVGPGREVATDADLGWVCDWDVDQVAAAMREALATAPTAARRAALREWTIANVSLTRIATLAAERVLAAAR